MYDELIESLRTCIKCSGCKGCKFDEEVDEPDLIGGELAEPSCTNRLMTEAADAIEELSEQLENETEYATALNSYAPQWIPVTERLPEEYKNVLCYYEYFRYGDYNCMFRTIDRGYYGYGGWGGEAGQGHKNKVLAWMPLPEPPKEEIC